MKQDQFKTTILLFLIIFSQAIQCLDNKNIYSTEISRKKTGKMKMSSENAKNFATGFVSSFVGIDVACMQKAALGNEVVEQPAEEISTDIIGIITGIGIVRVIT